MTAFHPLLKFKPSHYQKSGFDPAVTVRFRSSSHGDQYRRGGLDPVQEARVLDRIDSARPTRRGFGLGQALDQLRELGLRPSERAVDLALLAAVLTAADTRVSRTTESQDAWTREIDLHIPVADPAIWEDLVPLIRRMLDFLTGDRWGGYFRPRTASLSSLATPPEKLRTANPTGVCLSSGGLDSFIGAIDLFASGKKPMLVSHYWDGITSKHQNYCGGVLKRRFPAWHG
jgi:hypothetical protein